MEFDPVELAEEIRIAYSTDFIGDRNVLFTNILSRYGDNSKTLREKLPSLIKIRGPFIQALPIPRWSDVSWIEFSNSVRSKFAPRGMDAHLSKLFGDRIRRLYVFQERAIEAILDDLSALVVAGTGRGKTESWLIPILQFVLMAKRGKIREHPPNSVKAILVYPTKALTQDQLKRLIKYLFELNSNLPANERITIGVYDGDTPSIRETTHMPYLINAFKYFKCPMFDSEKALCRECDSDNGCSLTVVHDDKGIPKLQVPMLQCQAKIPLDFIHLTRDDIRTGKVDLLLTNPDTINFRLINVNADLEREAFIKEPKFVVLDEIHTFTGLFGSFVSFIMRRFKLVRKNLLKGKSDDLRIIGASATVRNKEEVFTKIAAVNEHCAIIEEEHTSIAKELPSTIPDFLVSSSYTAEDVIAQARRQLTDPDSEDLASPLLQALNLCDTKNVSFESDNDLGDFLSERVFEGITTNLDERPELDIIRALHTELLLKARLPKELHDLIHKKYPNLDGDQTRNLVQNFFTIGELSGILENRIHLFAWPLDGFYSCINCGSIFDSPQSECTSCHHHFITRISTCKICDEEVIESWFCPNCLKLFPLVSNVEGKSTFFDVPTCNCTGEAAECIRVLWRPYFKCRQCGKITKKSYIERCEVCGSKMLFDETGTHISCTNPNCAESTRSKPAKHCPSCGSDLELLITENIVCPHCGNKSHLKAETICQCGFTMHPILYLPWICSNENCKEVINAEKPPAVCKCGATNFFLSGIFDLTYAYHCDQCKTYSVLPLCKDPKHTVKPQMVNFKDYRLLDNDFIVRKTGESHKIPPCYHKRARYNKRRYLPLFRSPENVAVTSAQHALRKIVNHVGIDDLPGVLRDAKILSFSDSHNDMEHLNRSFQEPEQQWFMDQLLVSILERGDHSLQELYDQVQNELNLRQEMYSKTKAHVKLVRLLGPRYQYRLRDEKRIIRDELDKRIFGGLFEGRFEINRPVYFGVIDIALDLKGVPTLSSEEKLFLRTLWRSGKRKASSLVDFLSPRLRSFDAILNQLKLKKLIVEEPWGLRISPDKIICTLVSTEHPISWDPAKDAFYPTIDLQLNEKGGSLVKFDKKFSDRTDIFKSGFSKLAFRIGYSSPVMLISEAYIGTTDKKRRRELEFQFKNGIYPNFLSSGPAMELGIDIGELDILCLYGTPPNINSYLQRIGRAGRATKKSLVFSVSKRNPIDYFYYKHPHELIQSEPQPVPVNEHNPEVLRVSLSWALFDYIATKFWIPWRREMRPDGERITDGEEVVRKEPAATKPENILSFTRVYYRKNIELDFGRKIAILAKLVTSHKQEALAWLQDLLDYSYCPRCGRMYPSIYLGNCQAADCSTNVVNAKDRFANIIEETLEGFTGHFISLAAAFFEELRKQKKQLHAEQLELMEKLDDATDETEKQRLALASKSNDEMLYQLHKLHQEMENMPYSKFHKKTKERKFAFDIRSIREEVTIVNYTEEQENGAFHPVLESRGVQMALKESHPYSVKTRHKQKWVACRFFFDTSRRADIKQIFPDQLICSLCFEIYSDLGKSQCDCGGSLKILETQSPTRIEVYPANRNLRINVETGKGQLKPLDIHANSDATDKVKSTFPTTEVKITNFKPFCGYQIKNNMDEEIGRLEYGILDLATTVESYTSFYESGFAERMPKYFELCGEEDCNSVVNQKGNHICCRNSNHNPDKKKYVRLASLFSTYGVKLSLTNQDAVTTHTLAHGLRIGLQNIAGVLIRNIGEILDGDHAYIHDEEPGGSGVTNLLTVLEDGNYKNFKHVMILFGKHLASCNCDDGCPNCTYQYGCVVRNDPRLLSRKKALQWMEEGVHIIDETAPS